MASTYVCPKGHVSNEDEYCSECGAKIRGVAAASAPAAVNNVAAGNCCPDCQAPVPPGGVNFCEICGYNFVTRTSGQFPAAAPPVAAPPTPAPEPTPSPAPAASYRLTISVDATLRTQASPDAPEHLAPMTYAVDKPVNLIGRKSEARAVFPEIPLDHDTAVSHRHGVISLTPEGQLIYRDLGSANGTRLNGTEVTPMSDVAVKAGDQITLGHWTRISVESGS